MIAPTVNTGKAKAPPKRGGLRYVVLGGVVVAIAAIIAVIMQTSRHGDTEQGQEAKRKDIAGKVSPVKIGIVEGVDAIPEPATPKQVVTEPKTNQWGNPAHWGHKKLRPSQVHRLDRSTLPLYEQIFPNSADRDIAGLIVIEPGTDLIGSDEFDERFVKSFLKSIESPIIIGKDDSEEEKALKRAVIETKIELKARYDAGEDIAKILTDTRRELRELGAYREDLKNHLDELRRDGNLTVDEMKDYVEAANVMLEERGAKKIVLPEFYYRQIEYRNKMRNQLKGEQ